MTKEDFWGITPLMYTRASILSLIEELKSERKGSLRKVATDSGVSYDVLKDYCLRKDRTTRNFSAENLNKLLLLNGKTHDDLSSQKVSYFFTLKEVSVSLLPKSGNILLSFLLSSDQESESPSLALELSQPEATHLVDLVRGKLKHSF